MIQTNDIEENLKRGLLEMLILKMLSHEDMYGYQMISEMNIRGKGLIEIKEGSLYGPLYRLIGKNYISQNKVLVGKRRTRVYYHLESLGAEYLNTMMDVYSKITEGVNLIMNYSDEGEPNANSNPKRNKKYCTEIKKRLVCSSNIKLAFISELKSRIYEYIAEHSDEKLIISNSENRFGTPENIAQSFASTENMQYLHKKVHILQGFICHSFAGAYYLDKR